MKPMKPIPPKVTIYEDFKDCICDLANQVCTVNTSDGSQMNSKKFSIILHSQFNCHTLPVPPFKYIYKCVRALYIYKISLNPYSSMNPLLIDNNHLYSKYTFCLSLCLYPKKTVSIGPTFVVAIHIITGKVHG